MMSRRSVLTGIAAASMPEMARAQSGTVLDSAGPSVLALARAERVFPVGRPAAITLYTVAPE